MNLLLGVVCLLSTLSAISGDRGNETRSNSPFRKQPNVLVIVADDMGWNDIGYHNDAIQTPVLDELARMGRKLESAYALPVCAPSRAALLTGRYPHTIGMQHLVIIPGNDKPMPVDLLTIGEALQTTGYKTHLIGKWHAGDCSTAGLPTNRGFDTYFGFLIGGLDYFTRTFSLLGGAVYDFWNGTTIAEENSTEYLQDILERETIRLIEQSKESENPFFILHSTPIPHTPLQIKPGTEHLYAEVADEPRRAYLQMMATLDESVGRMVKALDESGQRSNTVIIFMSDNGGLANGFPAPPWSKYSGSNYPLRGSKSSLYDGGMRVPMFINSPLLPYHLRNTKTDALFHMTDWLPTILSWAGGDSSLIAGIDGVDQTRVLFGPEESHKPPRDHVVLQILDLTFFGAANYSNTSAAIRWGDYKLITGNAMMLDPIDEYPVNNDLWSQPAEWDVEGSKERKKIVGTKCGLSPTDICLFNIKEDPSETTDISAEHPDVVNRLLSVLENEKTRIREPVFKGLGLQPYSVANISDAEEHLAPGYCDDDK